MAKKEEKALTVQEELKAKIQENSGEGQLVDFDFTPVITIDNSSEEKEVDGEMVDVRVKPRFKMQTGMEEGQSELMESEFNGVMVKLKYFVTKKYEPKPSIPFFYSQEFSSGIFTNGGVFSIKHKVEDGEDKIETLTYKEFKEAYADMYKLNAVVYFLLDEQLVKIRLKGAAMSTLWDYLKKFKAKDDSMSFHNTVFTAIRKKEPQPYNALELKVDDSKAVDLEEVLRIQDTLADKKENELAKAIGGQVINEGTAEDIKVEDIPFN